MQPSSPHVLLTPSEMGQADQLAMAGGILGARLMEAAGRAVAEAVQARWRPRPVLVLCGPGNNGGDGFVVARLLASAGWPVTLGLLGERQALRGDAAWAAGQWNGPVHPAHPDLLQGAELVVDALFGAGLSRDVDGVAAQLLCAIEQRGLPVCAVDVPSGIDGETGAVRGAAVHAALTVTFFRKKPGHLLLPGRQYCGETQVADIGIPQHVLEEVASLTFENAPALWASRFPWPQPDSHKYRRGHVLVAGGGQMTGAARLVAMAAARVGAGLVTVAAPAQAWSIYATALTSIMVENLGEGDLSSTLVDTRRNAIVLGPGAGVTEQTRRNVLAAAATGRALVLDADALTVFTEKPDELFSALRGPCVLTPHDGEFQRLFQVEGDRLARARAAARHSGTVVILKGADTVVAEPGGRAVINVSAPPWLATAGAGDVLAGVAAGLLAQGMPVFESACAAVWLHGRAAALAGPGLISEDLPGLLPQALRQLYEAGESAGA